MLICTNDRYCETPNLFASVAEFLSMCAACFGERPTLTRRIGSGSCIEYIDETGAVVLRTA